MADTIQAKIAELEAEMLRTRTSPLLELTTALSFYVFCSIVFVSHSRNLSYLCALFLAFLFNKTL
jgi:hypothetical protein